MPPPQLIIFDCDGVLVDSEPISIGVLIDLVSKSGHEISADEAYERFLGKSMASICAMLGEDPGIDVTPGHLEAMRATLYSRFAEELQPIGGIAETLDRLERDLSLPRCVASSSQPERIALSLKVTGLLHRLEPHIFSATMVARGKPAPDLFLHAAGAMATAPDGCLVIEDSAAGIEAAKRAGMTVFAFTGGSHARHPTHLARIASLEPDLIFDNMRALPDLLAG